MIPPAPAALLHKLQTLSPAYLQSIAPDAPMPSPCISVCHMDGAQQYCVGCLRTLDELCVWGNADHATRRGIWQRVRERASHSESTAL